MWPRYDVNIRDATNISGKYIDCVRRLFHECDRFIWFVSLRVFAQITRSHTHQSTTPLDRRSDTYIDVDMSIGYKGGSFTDLAEGS